MKAIAATRAFAGWFAAALIVAALPVRAAELALTSGAAKPVASITIPDAWHPTLGPRGAEATAPGGQAFLAARIIKADEKAASDYDAETTGTLEEQGVVFPPVRGESRTTDLDTKINGLDTFVSRLDEPTTFRGSPTTLTYYAVPVSDAETLNIVTRGPRDDPGLAAVVATLKPVR